MKPTVKLIIGGVAVALAAPVAQGSPAAGRMLVKSDETPLQCFWFAKWYESGGGGVTCYGGAGTGCVSCKN